jgi:hypothetical protein
VPKGVVKLVFSSSDLFMKIWWYPEKQSSKLSILEPVIASTKMSMHGKGYSSFGQSLLTLVKSMHIRHFPFFFGTMMTFASHYGTGLRE